MYSSPGVGIHVRSPLLKFGRIVRRHVRLNGRGSEYMFRSGDADVLEHFMVSCSVFRLLRVHREGGEEVKLKAGRVMRARNELKA